MIFSESSLGFYRTALKGVLDYNNVLLQGAQRVRQYQLEQIEAAMSDYGKLSGKLDKDSKPEQLLAAGSELAGGQMERSLAYWNGLSNALGQNQLELAGVLQSRTLALADGFKQQLDDAPAAVPVPGAATLKMVADMVHNSLSTAQQLVPAAYSNGAQHAGRGKEQESRGKQQESRAQRAQHH